MQYLYVGYYVEDETFSKILERKINNMSVARQKFEYNLIRGLHEQLGGDVGFVSYVPTDGSVYIPECSRVEGADIRHIAIQKNSAMSIVMAYRSFKRFLLGLGEENLRGLKILMYAVIPPFEQAILDLKKRYGLKMVTICSEVPELRRYGNSLPARAKKKILTHYNEQFDGYILFSKAMTEVVRTGGKPYSVVEGIAPEIRNAPTAGKKNVVMYAGGLASDNNIPLLIECCQKLDELEEIWICGNGADEDKIKQLSEKDARVKYYGQVPNNTVLDMESKAKVLVNFRNPEERLTKYSFPSKILEYIASGSLVVSTRLVGIPDEYFEYILPIDINNTEDIQTVMRGALLMGNEEYTDYCKKAQQFIAEKKNYYCQTKNIIAFLDGLR